jgi:DNA-binding response OmpR family regulator
MSRILIVEDNPDLAFAVSSALETDGYEVVLAESGPDGLQRAESLAPDLIVLDLMLPGFDGYRVLRTLRERGVEVPVLILTARGEEEDKVRGFQLGADDYVTKPFGAKELLARVGALLRRPHLAAAPSRPAHPQVERFGEVEVNRAARVVRRAGTAVALKPKEYDLLVALLDRRGSVASRLDLLKHVWGYQEEVMTRTVDIHVAELRRKLERDPAQPAHIVTVRKVGYRLER